MSGGNKNFFMFEDTELENKFKVSFLKNSQNMYSELEEAIKTGDIKHAFRLVHSIKGNAGQAKMEKLAKAAAEIETLFSDGETSVPEDKLINLKNEFESAIVKLKPLIDAAEAPIRKNTLNKEQTLVLFDKLKPLLEDKDSESFEFLDEIRSIPEAEGLAAQIEQYDFESALKTLNDLEIS